MRKGILCVGILALLLGGGCASTPKKPHAVKKVFVVPFANHTVRYDINTALMEQLNLNLMKTARVTMVNENEAGYRLEGDVTLYEIKPLAYTPSNQVESYELDVWAKVKLVRTVDGSVVWEDDAMMGNDVYRTVEGMTAAGQTPDKTNAQLEDDSRLDALQYLAQDIAKKVVTGGE